MKNKFSLGRRKLKRKLKMELKEQLELKEKVIKLKQQWLLLNKFKKMIKMEK
jgi:hypothetical protein